MLGGASILATVSELLPALVIKRIVDEVFVPVDSGALALDQRFKLLGILVLTLIGIRLVAWSGGMGARMGRGLVRGPGNG